ncbi:MAG: hypothetical protein IOD12_11930 [Silvanigrellales bacterium]|nr:hypothetical protein [Silvanigrellales bacterium]
MTLRPGFWVSTSCVAMSVLSCGVKAPPSPFLDGPPPRYQAEVDARKGVPSASPAATPAATPVATPTPLSAKESAPP